MFEFTDNIKEYTKRIETKLEKQCQAVKTQLDNLTTQHNQKFLKLQLETEKHETHLKQLLVDSAKALDQIESLQKHARDQIAFNLGAKLEMERLEREKPDFQDYRVFKEDVTSSLRSQEIKISQVKEQAHQCTNFVDKYLPLTVQR